MEVKELLIPCKLSSTYTSMKYMETGGSDIEVGGLLWKSMTASTERGCRSFKLVQVHFHQQQWKLPRASMEVNWKLFYFKN